MEITIKKGYDEYTINLFGISKSEVLKFQNLANEILGIAQKPVEIAIEIPDTSKWTKEYLQYLEQSTSLYYNFYASCNKILTIKYIRTITNPSLGLKEAKDFVEYVTANAAMPSWVALIKNRVW